MMEFSEFLSANFWYIFLAVFLGGTFLLSRTRFQRTFIIFLIRTKHGIRWLDKLASLSPRGWTFLADLAVIVSFGGLGTLYVSKYRKIYPFLLILGVIALLMLIPTLGTTQIGILFVALLASLMITEKLPSGVKSKVAFGLTVVIMFGIFLGFTGNLRPGLPGVAISLVTGIFGLPGLLVGSLASQASSILLKQSSLPGISPLLPGMNSEGQLGFMFPGFDIFIPLWSGLIALIILLVSHEFSHGILARVHKIKVNNMGLLTFGILPIGAFVEPDEKSMEKRKSEEKMRVYAMGSFANLSVAMLSVVLLLGLSFQISGMVESNGIEIVSVQEGFPAEILEPGSVITKVNGVSVKSVEEYLKQAARIKPGDEVSLETDKGAFKLKAVANPNNASKSQVGYSLRTSVVLNEQYGGQDFFFSFLLALTSLFNVIFFLNLNVAIVNLLPIVPFDGSKMFDELLKSFKLSPEKRKRVIKWVVMIILFLLILNALPLGNILVGAFGMGG